MKFVGNFVPRGTNTIAIMFKEYDVIVVGAGHAGCEAAQRCGFNGFNSSAGDNEYEHHCSNVMQSSNGWSGKGSNRTGNRCSWGDTPELVSDKSMIQFRMLNLSKGPAMWSPRTQNDRMRFSEEWRLSLGAKPQH